MTTEEDDTPTPDDRWSAFEDPLKWSSQGTKPKEDPGPDLSEYIEKVIEQRSPRKRHERMYKMASHLVRLITGLAQALTTEWKLFLQTDRKGEIRTTQLRSLSVDQYECMTLLKRSLKPDAFKFVQRGHEEMLLHQYRIKINPGMSNEEALLVRREWEPNVDKHGHLVTNQIFDWFNIGISKACSILMAESKNISVLRCETMHDGTINVHSTISSNLKEDIIVDKCAPEEGTSTDVFCINIYPIFTINSLTLPPNLSVSSPLPVSGPFVFVQKTLKETLLKDLDNGKQIVFLEPKKDVPSSPSKCSLPSDGLLWRLNQSFVEQHVFQMMDRHCRVVDYRQVLVLMNIIREQVPSELRILNNEMLVHTMFITCQREFYRLTALHDWFLELLKAICKGLKSGFLSSFYVPRQNLLTCYCVSDAERKTALKKLEEILQSTKENPKTIFDFTGYIEKKKNKPDTDSSEEDADSQSDSEAGRKNVEDGAEEPDKS